MDRMKNFIKKNRLYLLFLVLAISLVTLVFIVYKFMPFGNNSLMISDLTIQEYPMLVSMRRSILEGNVLYSWEGGTGAPFYRMYFNYMSSPLNLIVLLFSAENVVLCIHLLIVLKMILAGLAFIFYVKRKFKTDKLVLVIPALLYAFCGYITVWYFNIKWTDMLIFLPLLTLSIEKLCDKHKITPFIIILMLIMWDNFYMGYMMCIYTIIYFMLYNLFYTKGKSVKDKINNMSKNFLIILGATTIFALLSAFFLLPNYYASTTFGAIGGGFPTKKVYDFDFLDYLVRLLPYTYRLVNDQSHNAPIIYSGVLAVLSIIPYIFNKNIKIRDKMFNFSILLIFTLIFFIPILDFIINAFHMPNGLPYRYSFMFSFILLVILSKQLITDHKRLLYIICGIILALLGVVFIFFKPYLIYENYVLILIGIIACYTIAFMFKSKIKYVIIVFILMVELFFNLSVSFGFSEYNIMYDSKLYETLSKYDDKLYRIDTEMKSDDGFVLYAKDMSLNLSYLYGYKSLSSFDSTQYFKHVNFNSIMNILTNGEYTIYYTKNTPIFTSLFNIKYTFNGRTDDDKYLKLGNGFNYYKYNLSMIYGVKGYDSELKIGDSIYNQSTIVKDFTSIDNIIEEVNYTKRKLFETEDLIAYEYTINNDETYFIFDDPNILAVYDSGYAYSHNHLLPAFIDEYLNDKKYVYFAHYSVLFYTSDKKLDIIYLKSDEQLDPLFYKVNDKKFHEMYDYLSQYQANIEHIDTNGLKGNITLDKDMKVFTTIAYDKGWKAYVDGKKVDTYEIYDTYLGFDVGEGYHEFELKYEIPYLKEGLIISLSTFGLIVIYNIFKKVRVHERH